MSMQCISLLVQLNLVVRKIMSGQEAIGTGSVHLAGFFKSLNYEHLAGPPHLTIGADPTGTRLV